MLAHEHENSAVFRPCCFNKSFRYYPYQALRETREMRPNTRVHSPPTLCPSLGLGSNLHFEEAWLILHENSSPAMNHSRNHQAPEASWPLPLGFESGVQKRRGLMPMGKGNLSMPISGCRTRTDSCRRVKAIQGSTSILVSPLYSNSAALARPGLTPIIPNRMVATFTIAFPKPRPRDPRGIRD